MKTKFSGVVLAGGKSRRFGSPKAFAKKGKKAFYQYSLDALSPLVDELIIVTNPSLFPGFDRQYINNLSIVNDHPDVQAKGPLSGLWTAMNIKAADWYIVLPVDVPFMETRILERIKKHGDSEVDAIIPIVSHRKQPLIAIYSHQIKNKIKDCLESDNYSVDQVLSRCKVKYIHIEEEQPFYNINKPDDYNTYISR
ncbi:molybdopterin-guanine dinucleotide biosynthesis protein A [Salinibacillus kushneri]|uniref:Probable molybdenum cofactor guanylyltransferase n=1 Tax=Salinibacillus kushneri TaxID=237682 RepID=A0A1I0DL44_9BACI|nr:molybdenum cofactor guanylyltransferase [Salinibacillus kushneri]SET33203.1 molybdopterin-guanine dinucleotide biosynthesis protein A [Salinibacillus kushneri]